MTPDLTPDTNSEWLERGLMLAGVALFFTALLIAGPLPSMVGFLDDDGSANSADLNESAIVDESTPDSTETMGTEDRSGGGDGASTESSGQDGSGDQDGDEEDGDSDDQDGDSDESDDSDEDDDSDESDDSDEDDDDDDDKPGKGHGRDNNNGRGNG